MRLVSFPPREGWRSRVENLGFDFHSLDGKPYWVEDRAYEFTTAEVELIESSTIELQRICIDAVSKVISGNRFSRLAIPDEYIPLIVESWERDDPTLYGRFDLCLNGLSPPKMMEYNADTPTALLESSLVQWQWLGDRKIENADQFNFLEEALVEAWTWYRRFVQKREDEVIYFSCLDESIEDLGTIEYLRGCASRAGLATGFIYMHDIGWDGGGFVDLDGAPILHLFKLYPWEMMVREEFGKHLSRSSTRVLEPAWKMILSNKAVLPLLWEWYPGHPNLLPSYFDAAPLGGTYVKKPIFSREGANVTIVREGESVSSGGDYGKEGFIYQEFCPLPKLSDYHVMVGSWVVGSSACGMCIRESRNLITDNWSCFAPHYFLKPAVTRGKNRFFG